MQTPYDPVFVMFDDSGFIGEGSGEKALKYVATHKQIDVLGILAVASNTPLGMGTCRCKCRSEREFNGIWC